MMFEFSMEIIKQIKSDDWNQIYSPEEQGEALEALENGKIILLPDLDFKLLPEEKCFLSPTFSEAKSKNISFNVRNNRLRGTQCKGEQQLPLKAMMQRFAVSAKSLMDKLYPSYAHNLQFGRTSFRPVEIFGRTPKSYRKDDTRLHVDAFPTTPTQGKRIIRVFTNINPNGNERLWRAGESFEEVARRFLPTVKKPWFGRSAILRALKITRSYCTEYDYTMLQIHNNMKADLVYQKTAKQCELRFKAGSSWIVQTDQVSHAALKGQYVLEQTFYLPVLAMANPQLSPLRTLENLAKRILL